VAIQRAFIAWAAPGRVKNYFLEALLDGISVKGDFDEEKKVTDFCEFIF